MSAELGFPPFGVVAVVRFEEKTDNVTFSCFTDAYNFSLDIRLLTDDRDEISEMKLLTHQVCIFRSDPPLPSQVHGLSIQSS